MRKFLRALIGILVTVAVVILLMFLVRLESVDKFLTNIFGEANQEAETDTRIIIDGYSDELSDEVAPFVYYENGKLMLALADQDDLDITPPLMASAYVSDADLPNKLRTRKYCTVSDSKTKILFEIVRGEVPVLYLTDIEARTTVLVAENINSFAFIGETPIYATGYDKVNDLYAYLNCENVKLASNMTAWPVDAQHLISLSDDGTLKIHFIFEDASEEPISTTQTTGNTQTTSTLQSIGAEQTTSTTKPAKSQATLSTSAVTICEGVQSVPTAPISTGTQIVCYILRGEKTQKVKIDIENYEISFDDAVRAPSEMFVSATGNLYRYWSDAMIITRMDDALTSSGTQIFSDLGDIVSVKYFNSETGEFVVANNRGLYLIRPEAANGTQNELLLTAFEDDFGKYKKKSALIRENLAVESQNGIEFYVSYLIDGSFILNSDRTESWMNKFSSYLYGLYYLSIKETPSQQGNMLSCTGHALGLAPSRVAGHALYSGSGYDLLVSRFSDGSIRTIAVSNDGVYVTADIMGTGAYAMGQCRLRMQAGDEVIFALSDGTGEYSDYFTLVEGGNAVCEIPDYTPALSLGKFVRVGG